ncbi:ABZJ_00895 family protein [Sulfuricurvum sp. RIFCSPLOWO2_12_FULL_43_24]|uniref:ABZJ_00895 family protein n=1 Tax=Sulfuricurvum sp. RIFCSPLOWO2_12_FULL_43_24 TaxID=1802247 RepID=UPI0008C8DF8F|nr:ABZJ_00895 family protein [Sulfuricurvum sp. RIFCSPLOWO2_12_FULL_43_24]OHD88378.1 MAG: hypothetical protein A3G19_10800 [Sulfuricurvum sp. RIFCSPLOWO2_12_FULL_43_24]
METSINFKGYLIRFTFMYIIASVAIVLIAEFLHINNAGMSMVPLVTAAAFAIGHFVNDHGRIPTSKERSVLVFGSLGISTLVSSVMVGLFLAFSSESQALVQALLHINMGVMIAVFAFVLGICAAMLWMSYGWFAKIQLRALERKRGVE